MTQLDWTTQQRKVADLLPNEKNPRTLSDKQREGLAASLAKFNLVEIPVINHDGTIIAGHQRIKTLIWLNRGDELIDVRVPNRQLSETELKEYMVLSNTHAGEWDVSILEAEFGGLDLEGFGVDFGELVADVEIEEVPEQLEAKEDDYVADPRIKTDIVKGDLIEFVVDGEVRHRLLCGDSTVVEDVEKVMGGEKADMILTDPPYNVNYGADTKNPKWSNSESRTIDNDHMSGEDFNSFIYSVFANAKNFCDGVIYCFGAQGKDGRIMFSVLDNLYHNSGTIIWVKDRFVLGRGKYHNQYEPCWFGWINDGSTFTEDRTRTNIWNFDRPNVSKEHPTMKPIPLLAQAIKDNPKAKSVLDFFLGSGSTMVAAHQLNRKCYGIELSENYCQVIVDRMLALDPSLKLQRNGADWTGTKPQ